MRLIQKKKDETTHFKPEPVSAAHQSLIRTFFERRLVIGVDDAAYAFLWEIYERDLDIECCPGRRLTLVPFKGNLVSRRPGDRDSHNENCFTRSRPQNQSHHRSNATIPVGSCNFFNLTNYGKGSSGNAAAPTSTREAQQPANSHAAHTAFTCLRALAAESKLGQVYPEVNQVRQELAWKVSMQRIRNPVEGNTLLDCTIINPKQFDPDQVLADLFLRAPESGSRAITRYALIVADGVREDNSKSALDFRAAKRRLGRQVFLPLVITCTTVQTGPVVGPFLVLLRAERMPGRSPRWVEGFGQAIESRDSWLPVDSNIERHCLQPLREICRQAQRAHPTIAIAKVLLPLPGTQLRPDFRIDVGRPQPIYLEIDGRLGNRSYAATKERNEPELKKHGRLIRQEYRRHASRSDAELTKKLEIELGMIEPDAAPLLPPLQG